jgi:hypothetical protein
MESLSLSCFDFLFDTNLKIISLSPVDCKLRQELVVDPPTEFNKWWILASDGFVTFSAPRGTKANLKLMDAGSNLEWNPPFKVWARVWPYCFKAFLGLLKMNKLPISMYDLDIHFNINRF